MTEVDPTTDDRLEHDGLTERMHVLGLTDMRVDEMREPFEELGSRGTLVTVDPDDGIGAYASALATGSRRIERRDSDAILAYNGSGLIGVVGTLLGRYHGIPLLIRQNGDIFRQHREATVQKVREREWRSLATYVPFALLTRAVFYGADGFVPVTATLAEPVSRQTGCPTDRIVPVPNPVRIEEYAPPESEDDCRDADDGRRLLTVTNLDFRGKYEGVTELVDGVVPVLRRRPELEYVVAGDGRYYDRLSRYLDERVDDDVRRRIHAPGFVDDVAELYWDADVFLYASYIDGYPNVILEAQAAGLPIVTNPAYGIAEQIDDGESGLFVDPGDSAELASTVSSLLDDPAERDRLGRNARDRVETENGPEAVASQLYDAVRTIVEDRAARPPTDDPPRASDEPVPAADESPSADSGSSSPGDAPIRGDGPPDGRIPWPAGASGGETDGR